MLISQLLANAGFLALITAAPQPQTRSIKPNLVLTSPTSAFPNRTYTPDEVHNDIMKNHPFK